MNRTPEARVPGAGPAQATLRRLIQYALLFALVVITASGLSGLLERLFNSGATLASTDVAGLALALAFTLIGGPLVLVLWWFVWRRLDDEAERAATGWALYVTAMYAVSLIIFSTSLLGLAESLIGRPQNQWASPLANGIVWAGIWTWHRWMWKHPGKPSARREDVRIIIGSVFGLLMGTSAAVIALSALLDVVIRGYPLTATVEPWWYSVARPLVWAAGGAVIWWWHWFREGGRRFQTGLVDVAMVGVGIFAAGILALGGSGVILFVLLRLAFDLVDPLYEVLEPLAPALAAAAVGAVVWRYHRLASVSRSGKTGQASRLVSSAVALTAAASGIGVIVSSLLATAVSPLAGGSTRTLLLGGISSLLVGGPVWWTAWKPTRQPQTADAVPHGRRVYLIAFFGVSAVVALVTLLVIGYRLFEFLLGDVSGGSLTDRIRGPLGLLVAAGLVAGYHFALWRRDRTLLAAALPARQRLIQRVTLVTGSPQDALARGITEATGGAKVTTWQRADHSGQAEEAPGSLPAAEDTLRQVIKAMDGVTARHVLVVLGPANGINVIPLAS